MKRSRIPEDFEVSAIIMELAEKKGWPDPHKELEAFKLHHEAKGNVMVNWEKSFMLWLSNQKKWAEERGKPVVPYKRPKVVEPPKPKPAEPELTEDQRRENIRKFGDMMHGLVKKWDVRKAHEKA